MAVLPTRYDLLRSRLDRLARMVKRVETADIRAVHGARVASRRLRELLPVLQLDSDVSDKLGRRLRKVTRALGPVRELDVLLLLIDALLEAGRHDPRGLSRVRDHVQQARDHEHPGAAGKAAMVELHRVVRKLERVGEELTRADGSRESRAWRWALDARVARRATTLCAAISAAGALYLPERLHVVRIALKKLRYAAELAAEACGTIEPADLRTLKRGQELLGRLHDMQVLIDRVRQVQASLVSPDEPAGRELDTLVDAFESACRRLHARYVRERLLIVAICDRLGTLTSQPSSSAARRVG